MICKKCNAEIRDDAKFYPHCGTNIAEQTTNDSRTHEHSVTEVLSSDSQNNPNVPITSQSSITPTKVLAVIVVLIVAITGVVMYGQHEEQLKEQRLQEELRVNDMQVLENVKAFISAGEWEKATKEAERMRSYIYGKEIEAMQAYADAVIAIQKDDLNEAQRFMDKIKPDYDGAFAEDINIFRTNVLVPAIAEKERIEREAKEPPMEITGVRLTRDIINTPEVGIYVHNIKDKVIDAFEINVYCYDSYDRQLYQYNGDNDHYGGIAQEIGIIPPGQQRFIGVWTLHGFDNTVKVNIEVRSIHFTDGTVWHPEGEFTIKSSGRL